MGAGACVSRRYRGTVARPRRRVRVATPRAVPHRGHAAGARARRAVGRVRPRAARLAGGTVGRAATRLGRMARTGRRAVAAAVGRRRCLRVGRGRAGGSSHRRGRGTNRHHADRQRSRVVRRRVPIVTRRAAVSVLDGQFVVGWIGSFRKFHALEQAVARVGAPRRRDVAARRRRPRARPHRTARSGTPASRLVCTGTVAHDDIPEHLAAMDVGLVLASSARTFHYSPLKLAEYFAAGLPVVAPRAGGLPTQLRDGVDALLVEPGDPDELAAALRRLRDDPAERDRLGRAARSVAAERWSWDRSVERVLAALARSGTGSSTSPFAQ